MEESTSEKRIITFDILRVIAAFAVIFLHISAQYFQSYLEDTWIIRNIYDASVRWCVPIFVMISGALFLNPSKNMNIRKLYYKNIFRIVVAFLFWSLIYAIYDAKDGIGLGFFVVKLFEGPFHLWFLKMIIGLYIATPILRVIVTSKKLEQYFICLAIITAYVIPFIFFFVEQVNSVALEIIEKAYNTFDLNIASGYAGYFILGHYLSTYRLSRNCKNTIYVISFLCFPIVIFLSYWFSHYSGMACSKFYEYLSPFTLFESTAIFIFVSDIKVTSKYRPILLLSSKLSFGIYLIHILVIRILSDYLGIDSGAFTPVLSIPLLSVAVFVISFSAIWLFNKLPYINKYCM